MVLNKYGLNNEISDTFLQSKIKIIEVNQKNKIFI